MGSNIILIHIFLVFTGAAVLSTLVLFTRQSLLVAYLLLGVLLGPWGLKLIPNATLASEVGDVGIIFLLFLLGVELNPFDLLHMFRKISWIAFVSSVVFMAIGIVMGYLWGFTWTESVVLGASMMFSSTIIGLKLLPSATLHHQRIGEVMIGILLMQDLIAIVAMLWLNGMSSSEPYWWNVGQVVLTLPALFLVAFIVERMVLRPLLTKFARVQEYVFLVAIAWCLTMAKLAVLFGLSHEIGAFIGGIAIAEGPIAHYITDNLRPIRDFCLVMFFFAIGASFDLNYLPEILVPALILSAILMTVKPGLFRLLLRRAKESEMVASEAGVRLGQTSEFSLLLGAMAFHAALISAKVNYLIQAMTMFTFIISCYWVVLKYPTPMAFKEKLHED